MTMTHEWTLIDRLLGDLGGAFGIGLVRIGSRLGLYEALRDHAPLTSAALAERTGLAERYVREWLAYNAASGYASYDADAGVFWLDDEQQAVFADPDSPTYLASAFDLAAAYLENQPRVEHAFRDGGGVSWDEQSGCLGCAVARFFRPGYAANLVAEWLPALEGVVERLERGARVADVGCGHGNSTVIMARAFPRSEFVGFDFHEASIEAARDHAREAGTDENVRFEVATAKGFAGDGFELVTLFDCLHDMGDPVGAVAHIRDALAPGGTLMVVEPLARDGLAENLNPVGRLYYAASTMVCIPTSLDQEVGAALGAQAGERRLHEVIAAGGFDRVRTAAETPFNLVIEARR